ncbi:MAG: hypothetical protein ACP5UV_04790 [Thermoplasmata archaeon]
MNLKLLKFVIKTRFTNGLLVIYALFTAFILIYLFSAASFAKPVPIFYKEIVYILSFFSLFSFISSSLMVKKSDSDFLFEIPLNKNEIAVSFYLSSAITSTFSIIFLGFFLPFVESGFYVFVGLADLIMVSLIALDMGLLLKKYKMRYRISALAVLILWYSLPGFTGIYLSPTSSFTGHLFIGTIVDIVIFVPLTILNIRNMGKIPFTYASYFKNSTYDVKNNKSFSGYSPVRAIYALNLKIAGSTGVMRYGANARAYSSRMSTVRIVEIFSAIAIAYGIAMYMIPRSFYAFIIPYYAIYAVFIFPMMRSYGIISSERLWLAFMSMPARTYMMHMSLSKALSILFGLLPLSVANMALYFLTGIFYFLILSLYTLLLAPAISIISIYISGIVNVHQITDMNDLPSGYRSSGFGILNAVFFMVFFALIVAFIYLGYSFIFLIAGMWIASVILITNGAVNKSLLKKLVNKNFV